MWQSICFLVIWVLLFCGKSYICMACSIRVKRMVYAFCMAYHDRIRILFNFDSLVNMAVVDLRDQNVDFVLNIMRFCCYKIHLCHCGISLKWFFFRKWNHFDGLDFSLDTSFSIVLIFFCCCCLFSTPLKSITIDINNIYLTGWEIAL